MFDSILYMTNIFENHTVFRVFSETFLGLGKMQ